jgi:predicted ATP-grasp superfamily ATP-dependent carboligase
MLKDALAYVLGSSPTALGAIRSLGRLGIPVVGADFTAYGSALSSKYCRRLLTEEPAKHPQEVLETLIREQKQHSTKGVLFPASDDFVLFVSRFRDQLADFFRFALPTADILERIINKAQQYKLAEEMGIPYPSTYYPQSISDILHIKDQLEYPALIKPYYSYQWQAKLGLKGIMVKGPDELVSHFKESPDTDLQTMVQSIVPGPYENIIEVCAYMSPKRGGTALALFVDRKIRQYPLDFGVGTYMDSVHDDQALEIGLLLLRRLNYRGAAAVEFKKDARNGTYKLLDLNARLWQQNSLATQAGVNFSLVQYLDLTDQAVELHKDYPDGVTWLDAIMDFTAYRELGESTPQSILSELRLIRRANCHAYFARDDLKPLIRQYLNHLVRSAPHRVASALYPP